MEAAPPSYEKATLVDKWDLIARYLLTRDLCSAALVCSRWHAAFIPHLWGNPASHFGIENDAVYVALTRFKRTLRVARPSVRSLTHTLHLPPAHAELYNGPNKDWVRKILERLPNLQSLIVRGLPFFDHAALQALHLLRKEPNGSNLSPPDAVELPASATLIPHSPSSVLPTLGLRLLDASRCPNVTPHSLEQALSRFDMLIYLDLSFTFPARDFGVLNSIRNLSGLQVLKLRGIGLKDDAVEILSKSIALRIRSLDIRDNLVTDRGVRSLLSKCFLPAQAQRFPSGQRSPSLLPYLGSEMLEIYQGEDFEGYLRNAFTGRFISRLAIEDAPDGGITHLYISGNRISVEGTSGLLRSNRLHVLDVGSTAVGFPAPSQSSHSKTSATVSFPGVEKLTPIFYEHATESMAFLRIDHSLITKDTPASLKDNIVPGRVELGDSSLPRESPFVELDSTSIRPQAVELAAEPPLPRYELPGDSCHSGEIHAKPVEDKDSELPIHPKRGGAFAPEVLPSSSTAGEQEARPNTTHALGVANSHNAFSNLSLEIPASGGRPLASHAGTRSYSFMAFQRKARLNAHTMRSHSLHPAMLPHVTTLVLTDVPAFSSSTDIADRLILFIQQCAEEDRSAHQQARLDYSLPPGRRDHLAAVKHAKKKIFALQRLVLELAAPDADGQQLERKTSWRHQSNKSMTGDRDSEALWTASETDFSFFGEEECGLPNLEPGHSLFYSGSAEKEVDTGMSPPNGRNGKEPNAIEKPRFDTISLISTFRKDRKLAHERSIVAGNPETETEGFWEGNVQVVRFGNALRNDEETDYYGNKFTNSYLYR